MTAVATLASTVPEVTLYIGDLHASRRPVRIKTLLGSCIAACLWDPEAGAGGMNHFMLPRSGSSVGEDSARFGVQAMDMLIGAIMKAGGDRRRFRAKVFGGGHVLGLPEAADSVPRQNIAFIREFVAAEGFRLIAEEVGGYQARHVHFEPHTGRAWVKRLSSAEDRRAFVRQERIAQAQPAVAPKPAYGSVELF